MFNKDEMNEMAHDLIKMSASGGIIFNILNEAHDMGYSDDDGRSASVRAKKMMNAIAHEAGIIAERLRTSPPSRPLDNESWTALTTHERHEFNKLKSGVLIGFIEALDQQGFNMDTITESALALRGNLEGMDHSMGSFYEFLHQSGVILSPEHFDDVNLHPHHLFDTVRERANILPPELSRGLVFGKLGEFSKDMEDAVKLKAHKLAEYIYTIKKTKEVNDESMFNFV